MRKKTKKKLSLLSVILICCKKGGYYERWDYIVDIEKIVSLQGCIFWMGRLDIWQWDIESSYLTVSRVKTRNASCMPKCTRIWQICLIEINKVPSMIISNKNTKHKLELTKIYNLKIHEDEQEYFPFFSLNIKTVVCKSVLEPKFCENFIKLLLLSLLQIFFNL